MGAVLGDHDDHPLVADYVQNLTQYTHHCCLTILKNYIQKNSFVYVVLRAELIWSYLNLGEKGLKLWVDF